MFWGPLKHTGAGLRWCRWTLVPNLTWHWDQRTHWYRWLLTDGTLKCKNFLTIKYSPVPITDTGDSMWFDWTLKSTNYLTTKYSPVPVTDTGDPMWFDGTLKSTNCLTTKYSPAVVTDTGDPMWFDGTLKSMNCLTTKYSPAVVTDTGDPMWFDGMLKSKNYLTMIHWNWPKMMQMNINGFPLLPDTWIKVLTCPHLWDAGTGPRWCRRTLSGSHFNQTPGSKYSPVPISDTLELARDDADKRRSHLGTLHRSFTHRTDEQVDVVWWTKLEISNTCIY